MILILIGFLLQATPSFALEDVMFGPEFTFMHLETGSMERAQDVYMRMYKHLVLGQPKGAKFTKAESVGPIRTTFTSPNGWWFSHHEEELVIEITSSIGTPEYFKKYARDMQDAIFVSAANEGFFPAMFRGGGHINVSSKSFLTNRLLFRNFLVDLFNHSELFMGVFGYDTNNALPIQMMPKENQKLVREVIAKFDAGEYPYEMDLIKFAADIQSALNEDIFEPFWLRWNEMSMNGRAKYHAVNLNHFIKDQTSRVEIRAVRPQASMDMWVRQISLIRDRIKYLETITEPIPFKYRFEIEPLDYDHHKLNPPVAPRVALREFYNFVRQSGHKWSDHRDYLWPQWVSEGHLEKFEKSEWFLRREGNLRLGKCEREFARTK